LERSCKFSLKEAVNSAFNPSVLNVFEFDQKLFSANVYFNKFFRGSTADKILEANDLNFTINSNFFNKNGYPLGLVVKEDSVYTRKVRGWKGFFFIKNGIANCGTENLMDRTSGKLESAIQSLPALIEDGEIFDYVIQKNTSWFNTNTISYRSLAGTKPNGNLVFIVSGNGGTLNIKEIALIAKKLNLQHSALFDGGKPLQYEFKHKDFSLSFHAFNRWIDFSSEKIKKQNPPVYIGIKSK